jgi:acyl-CoA synthetase (AMP-forming)/AMP-acid ligase II
MLNPQGESIPGTLINLIQASSEIRDCGIFYITGEKDEVFVSYCDLYHRALKLLDILQTKGLRTGDELVFQIDDNRSFIEYFWACILGGIIPVPVSVGSNDDQKLKLFLIWKMLIKPCLITDLKVFVKLEEYAMENRLVPVFENIKSRVIFTEEWGGITGQTAVPAQICDARPSDTAYIQFTSGTTGLPKGVILTHENLITNANAIFTGSAMTPDDLLLSWMPLTHDMGLNGCHLVPIWGKYDQYIMPTSLFIRRPNLWLKKAGEHRISILSTPNFGIKYSLAYYHHDAACDLDLSSVRLIFNGAEPISPKLCEEFLTKMGKHRLKQNTMFTVYGMAEAGLAVTFPPPGDQYVQINLDRNSVSIGDTIQKVFGTDSGISLVNLGYPVPGCRVRVCDHQNQVLNERTVGYIQIKGKNVTPGYYDNQPAVDKVFTGDGWLKTGDLGFMENGRLFVTGREKDIIIRNGRIYYPYDIERVVEEMKGIELIEAAVCGVPNDLRVDQDIILFVLFKRQLTEFIPLALDLGKQIQSETRLEVTEVIPVKKIPKTTSGKIQRYKLVEAFLSGEFTEIIRELRSLRENIIEKLAI